MHSLSLYTVILGWGSQELQGGELCHLEKKVVQFNQNTILANQLVQSASPIMVWVEQVSVLRVPLSCF